MNGQQSPLQPGPAATAQAKLHHEVSGRVLVVDDEARVRDAIATLLAGRGLFVATAPEGDAALRLLEQMPFDLVLLDLVMAPGRSGLDTLAELRRRGHELPVIVVSGDPALDSAIEALRLGAYDFVRKPFEPEELARRVENALEHARLARAQQEMENRLRRSEQLHRYLVNNSPDLIYTLDAQGRFTFLSPVVETLLGYPRQELIGQSFATVVHPEDREKVGRMFCERRTGRRASRGVEVRLKCKDGDNGPASYLVAEFNAMGMYDGQEGPGRARFLGTYGIARDISDRKRAEEAIAFQAYHDLLTGLPNRALMLDRLTQAIGQARRVKSQVAVMFLDLDNFKLVNDTLGHMGGDQLLKAVATRLKSCLREVDTCARIGGDEFVLILPLVNGETDTAVIADKILHALESKFEVAGQEIYATVSIGIALYPQDGETPEDLLKQADAAMYHAKHAGRNSYAFYRQVMQPPAGGHLGLLRDLRLALKRDELDVHYHPLVDIESGKILGLEALLRWHHPSRGLLAPGDFFAIAEESGLLLGIGEWVLDRVCRDLSAWASQGVPVGRVAINLSPKQLEREHAERRFLEALAAHRVSADKVGIEITENSVMKHLEQTLPKLRRLREVGVEISLDDFGTGYSSLGCLQDLPIDVLKVDQCFIRRAPQEEGHAAILRAIAALAGGLKLRLLVEGVETEDQLGFLRQLGCREYQGFLFTQPLPRAAVTRLLLNQARVISH